MRYNTYILNEWSVLSQKRNLVLSIFQAQYKFVCEAIVRVHNGKHSFPLARYYFRKVSYKYLILYTFMDIEPLSLLAYQLCTNLIYL